MRSLGSTQAVEHPQADAPAGATRLHLGCFACGRGEDGLGLVFDSDGAGGVSAEWFCEERLQSYPGIVHGGIIATVLDSAMTNCLLAKDIPALTAEMQIEYKEPVRVGDTAVVRAWLTRSRPPLFMLEAEVIQNKTVRARAAAKFMRTDIWSVRRRVQ